MDKCTECGQKDRAPGRTKCYSCIKRGQRGQKTEDMSTVNVHTEDINETSKETTKPEELRSVQAPQKVGKFKAGPKGEVPSHAKRCTSVDPGARWRSFPKGRGEWVVPGHHWIADIWSECLNPDCPFLEAQHA